MLIRALPDICNSTLQLHSVVDFGFGFELFGFVATLFVFFVSPSVDRFVYNKTDRQTEQNESSKQSEHTAMLRTALDYVFRHGVHAGTTRG